MKNKVILILSALLFSGIIQAHTLTLQERVPPVGVSDKGELLLEQGNFSYQNWNSAQLVGKVRVIQHIAGRTSAKELNAPFIEAIKHAKFPHDRYQTTTLVNTDDAIVGTGIFVRNSIEDSKRDFPWSQFVVDEKGFIQKAWQLQKQSSAIIVLDKEGKIRFIKEGAMTPQEIDSTMVMLHQLIGN